MGAWEFPTLGAGKDGETEAQGEQCRRCAAPRGGNFSKFPPLALQPMAVQRGSIPGDFTAAAFTPLPRGWASSTKRDFSLPLPLVLAPCCCWSCGVGPCPPLEPCSPWGLPGGHLPSDFCPSCSRSTATGLELALSETPAHGEHPTQPPAPPQAGDR